MKKLSIIFALLLVIPVFAQKSSKKDFSAFEQSLMNDSPAETAAESSDESDTTSVSEKGSSADFERSLMDRPSELNEVFIARDNLLEAIQQKKGDLVRIRIKELEDLNSESVVAIENEEKEYAFFKLRMFKDLLNDLVKRYKTAYEPSKFNENTKHASNSEDALFIVVKKDLDSRDSVHNIYYQYSDQIDRARMSEQEKMKLKLMLLLRSAYSEKDVMKTATNLAKRYVKEYPDDPDSPWIEKSVLGPLERTNIYEYKFKMRKENKEAVVKNKFYTGGFGIRMGVPLYGFGFQFGFNDFYRKDLFEPEIYMIDMEAFLQINRFVLSLGFVNAGLEGVGGFGFDFGYVLYESRYFKVSPFVGAAFSEASFETKEKIPYYGKFKEEIVSDGSGLNTFTLGINGDLKFGTPYFLLSDEKLVSFLLSVKATLSYIDIDSRYSRGNGLVGSISWSLGVFFW